MNTRLLIPLALAAAILACSGEEEASPPEQTPTAPATDAPATPPGMTATDHWFRGVVTEMNTGCYVDAICSVTVEVTESLGGEPLEEGTEVSSSSRTASAPNAATASGAETPPGREVEVLAHAAEDGSLAVCNGDHYFVKDLQTPE